MLLWARASEETAVPSEAGMAASEDISAHLFAQQHPSYLFNPLRDPL